MAKSQPAQLTATAGKARPSAKAKPEEGLEPLLAAAPALRRVLLQAKEKGSLTIDQLNAALPADFPPEQLDELIAGQIGRAHV